MTKDREQYTMGYGPAATAIMAQRTAQSHAGTVLEMSEASSQRQNEV